MFYPNEHFYWNDLCALEKLLKTYIVFLYNTEYNYRKKGNHQDIS